MADAALEKSVYSRHFNLVRYFGAWVVDPASATALNLYSAYRTLMTAVAFAGCASLFCDFYRVFGDFKKMTWNMCVTALFTGGVIKALYVLHRSQVINGLRRNLHRKAASRRTPEDERLNTQTEREWRFVRNLFYGIVVVFLPLWLISWYLSYLWGPRGIPVPLYLPFDYDLEDEFQYNVLFFSIATAGCVGISFVLENELAMFTILIQLSREYTRLINDLSKINELYESEQSEDGKCKAKEVNPWLRKQKTRNLVKEYSTRQQQLIKYTEDFELCYSPALVLQAFVTSLLVVVIAMLCIMEFGAISFNLSYQIGYIIIILLDMYLLCSWITRIHGLCLRVGDAAYACLWYEMSGDIRRDISMMIMRSQRPPKITAGKLMEMNLPAFMTMMKNIYSWLALFHQLAFKSS